MSGLFSHLPDPEPPEDTSASPVPPSPPATAPLPPAPGGADAPPPDETARRTGADGDSRKLPWWVTGLALGTLALLYLPMLSVALFSVNNAKRGYEWKGFTFKWYGEVFKNEAIMQAVWNTLILAVISTVIATAMGTMLAIGMDRTPWKKWFKGWLELMLYLPVVTPDIILAAAMVVSLGFLRMLGAWGIFNPGLPAMILGHVTFQIPFVALVVRSRLATMGPAVDEAARDLYGRTFTIFRRVTLPLALPGIVSGAMLAFTLSLDDFVISFFTTGPDSTTLPIYIYGELRRGITSTTHALSTLIFLATILLALGLQLLNRAGKGKS